MESNQPKSSTSEKYVNPDSGFIAKYKGWIMWSVLLYAILFVFLVYVFGLIFDSIFPSTSLLTYGYTFGGTAYATGTALAIELEGVVALLSVAIAFFLGRFIDRYFKKNT